MAYIRTALTFKSRMRCCSRGHRRRWGKCWRSAEWTNAFRGKNSGTTLLCLQILVQGKESSRKLLWEPFFAGISVADGHIENSPRKPLILGVRVSLDHDGHPLLEPIRGESGDLRLVCAVFLDEVMLTSHLAVDLA